MDTTAAVQDVRQKRELEVVQMKKMLDDEVKNRETQLQELRHKHTLQVEQLNEQVDQVKKVRSGSLSVLLSHLHLLFVCSTLELLYSAILWCHTYFYGGNGRVSSQV